MPDPNVGTFRFDDGNGNEWFVASPISDSGDELRSKVVKSARVTGKVTDASFSIYSYDVNDAINVSDVEDGTNSATGNIALSDTTQVAQSARQQLNVPNAVLSTIRIAGRWDGTGIKDRVDEAVYELAEQGVRR